jgi:hypothetical protein
MFTKLITTLLPLVTLPALAQKPTILMNPFPSSGLVGPTASACGFDILATPTAGKPNKEKLILFGNIGIATGPVLLTLKNLSTGKTIDVNSSSAGFITFATDSETVIATGPLLIAFPPPPPAVATAAGLPLVPLLNGRTVWTQDLQGNIISIQSFTGHAQDVCELLR